MKLYTQKYQGFSILEVLVGIFIFSLGLTAIFGLISSSMQMSSRDHFTIVASHLAHEQIEIMRNIRDTNYTQLKIWNQWQPYNDYTSTTPVFEAGKYYRLENTFGLSHSVSHVAAEITGFKQGKDELPAMQDYRLCMTPEKTYTYDCLDIQNKETPFYRYVYVTEAYDEDGNKYEDTYKIISKVIWVHRGYHEFEMQTLITDWRRI